MSIMEALQEQLEQEKENCKDCEDQEHSEMCNSCGIGGIISNIEMEISETDKEREPKVKKKPELLIFRVDEYSWYVAHDLMEFLNWYHKNIDSIDDPDELTELEMFDPEDGTMWNDRNITQEDVDRLGDCDDITGGGVGDLMRRDGEIYKRQTFADVLGEEDIKEPYEIASTEW